MDTEAYKVLFLRSEYRKLRVFRVKKIHTKYPKYRKEEDVLLKEEFHVGFDNEMIGNLKLN